MDVALVDVSSLRLRNMCKYRLSNNQSITLEMKDAKNSLTNSKFCESQFCNLHHASKVWLMLVQSFNSNEFEHYSL